MSKTIVPAVPTCVSKKRGTTGLVYIGQDPNPIGKVTQQNRRLRETGGQHGRAFTANVLLPDGTEVGGSLGTRFPSRLAAARAIRAFWRWLGEDRPETLLRLWGLPTDRDYMGGEWFTRYLQRQGMTEQDYLVRVAVSRAMDIFKYDHHDKCNLLRRYRGADPRRHWKSIPVALLLDELEGAA